MRSFFLTSVLFCITCFNSAVQTEKISVADFTKGTEGATKFIQALRKGDFANTMKTLIEVASPWLGHVGPLLKMGSDLFLPGAQSDAAYAKEQFLKINAQLDYLKLKQEENKNFMTYSFMRARFSSLESHIHTLTEKYNEVVMNNSDNHKRRFLQMCKDATLELALNELYQSVKRRDQIFSDNIINVTQLHTKHSRKEVQNFLLGVLELFLKGFELHLAELALDQYSIEYIATEKEKWINKLKEIRLAMLAADDYMKANYRQVFKQDLKDQIILHQSEDDLQFAESLKNYFAEKYYWFYVFVQVFKGSADKVYICEDSKVIDVEKGRNDVKNTETVVIMMDKELRDAAKPSIPNMHHNIRPGMVWSTKNAIADKVKERIGSEWCKSYVYISSVSCDDSNRERNNAAYYRNFPDETGTGFWVIPDDDHNFYRKDCSTISCKGKKAWGGGGGGSCTDTRDCRFCYRLVYF